MKEKPDLKGIRALVAGATPGEWRAVWTDTDWAQHWDVVGPNEMTVAFATELDRAEANAALIAAAPTALAALCDYAEALEGERDEARALLDAPELRDFAAGVTREAAHQRKRWGSEHDAGKTPFDWFWLVGYLAQKAADAHVRGDTDKALHHTISTAAALANWHAAILGKTDMRPGILPPAGEEGAAE